MESGGKMENNEHLLTGRQQRILTGCRAMKARAKLLDGEEISLGDPDATLQDWVLWLKADELEVLASASGVGSFVQVDVDFRFGLRGRPKKGEKPMRDAVSLAAQEFRGHLDTVCFGRGLVIAFSRLGKAREEAHDG